MRTIVGVSNRHIHLTKEHVEQLFGKGYRLRKLKQLLQPGQYACEETVTVHGPKGSIPNVRVLGPERAYSQLEISKTDGYVLGIDAPVRDSGDIEGTPGVKVSGPNGCIFLQQGVILPYRHLHLHPDDAELLGVKDKDKVSVKTTGVRGVILENVLCRVHPSYKMEFHIDTDEANASGLRTCDMVQVISLDGYHEMHTFVKKKVLVLNFGSSSVKYKVFEMPSEKVIRQGKADLPSDVDSIFSEAGSDIDIVAHRVVHGGERFRSTALITDDVYAEIEGISELAPLHNPVNLYGVRVAKQFYKKIPHYAVFDTSFHQTMPPTSYMYSLPYECYEKYKIRKYGFHGSSHRYVMERAAQIMGRPVDQLKLISCHIGNGVSITAIRNGESYDTSMGFTPLAGVAMGTRSGNIDPSIIPYLEQSAGLKTEDIFDMLNHQSGLLGISGISNDIRVLLLQAKEGHQRAQLAIEMFVARIHQFIGLYLARLNGADGLIFTAGIGENSPEIREKICQGLEFAGIFLETKANWEGKGERLISSPYSPVKVMVIPTNEELVMARDAYSMTIMEGNIPS